MGQNQKSINKNNMDLKRVFCAAAIALVSIPAAAQAQEKETPEYEFTTVKENPISSIKNQFRSGTCWSYSGIGFIESEIMRIKGYKDVDLSEMFIVRNSYHDRVIKYVRLDGDLRFGAGSSSEDVLTVIGQYGIVPDSVYNGMNYGTDLPEQNELDAVLAAYVKAVAANPNKKLTTAWLNGFDGILDAYLGKIPQEFEVDGVKYTPDSYRDYLGIVPEDYVSITSFTHHPYYSQFVVEVGDNWRWDTSYNVPLDEMMEIIYNAINKGYTIAWGADVSEKGFTRDGLGIVAEMDSKPAAGSDQERWVGKAAEDKKETVTADKKHITAEMRQDGYDRKTTTDDHGMQIYGIAKDQDGNDFFMVKNSWGVTGKYNGIWYISDTFVRYKTMNFLVHKDALPKDIKKKLGIR